MAVPILSDIFGTKPEIAPYVPTEFGPEQLKALKDNITAMPWITNLGNLYQTYMTGAYEKAIPGFSDILAMGGKLTQKMQATAGEELAGKIPQDVVEQVNRTSAYQNLMSGAGAGSGMGMANTARNLGLTSLDMISKGTELQGAAGNAAQRWAGLAANLIMSPDKFLATPAQLVELSMSNKLHEQATQQLRENVKAAPDPIAKGLSDIVENLTAAYLGGKVGTIGAGNEAATKATGVGAGPGPSDVTYPGYTMGSGGGLSAANSFNAGDSGGFSGLNLGASGMGASAYDINAPDLWSSYNPAPNYNPFQFGTGGTSGVASQNPLFGTGG